jgi:hypothetical protein
VDRNHFACLQPRQLRMFGRNRSPDRGWRSPLWGYLSMRKR